MFRYGNKRMKKSKFLGLDLEELIRVSLDPLREVKEDEPASNFQEKLQQNAMADENKKLSDRFKKESSSQSGDAADEGEEAPAKPVKIKHEKVPEINEESIADKINAIRSGKSLKDDDTMAALKTYFQKLNGPERIALFAFLAGLEKVLADGSGDVKTPHSKPFYIDMEKEEPKEKKPKGTKDPSTNDGGDNPIVVGESANKSNILRVIKSNRRR